MSTLSELSSNRIVATIQAVAAEDVPAPAKLRMMMVSFGAANWVTLQMLLLYLADLTTARAAIQLSMAVSLAVFGAYFVFSRAPEIAYTVELLFIDREATR